MPRLSLTSCAGALALAALLAVAPVVPYARAGDTQAAETAGTVLAAALPLAAGWCAVRQHQGKDFLAGFVAQAAVVEGLKYGLGENPINERPNGHWQGFPSGHMSAATFGATSLAQKCVPDRPWLGALAYALALGVGVSRVQADKHNPAQVAAGAVVGYFANGVTVSAEPGKLGLGYTLNF